MDFLSLYYSFVTLMAYVNIIKYVNSKLHIHLVRERVNPKKNYFNETRSNNKKQALFSGILNLLVFKKLVKKISQNVVEL